MADTPVSNSPINQTTTTAEPYANAVSGIEAQAKQVVDSVQAHDAVNPHQVAGNGGSFNGYDILDNANGNTDAGALNETAPASGMPMRENTGAAALNDLDVDASVVAHNITKPAAGKTTTIHAQPGEVIATNFDPSTANLDLRGKDLVMSFNDGSKIVLSHFADDAQNMPSIALPNGALVAGGIIIAQLQGTDEDLFNLQTAAGGVAGGGVHQYSDDLGSVIGLLDTAPPLPFSEMVFPQPDPRVTVASVIDFPNGTFGPTVTTNVPTTTTTTTVGGVAGQFSGGFEDWQPNKNVGDTSVSPAQFAVNFTPNDNEVVDQVTISNIPASVQFYYGTASSYTPVTAVNGSITFSSAQLAAGNIFIMDSSKSDTDVQLSVSLAIRDPDTNQTALLTQNTVVVFDAVADLPTVSSSISMAGVTDPSSVSGSEGNFIAIIVGANFSDNDGSETHTIIINEVPAEWTLESSPGYTFTASTAPNGTVTYTAVTTSDVNNAIVTFNPNEWSSQDNGTARLNLIVRAEENPKDGETVLSNNVAQISTPFAVTIAEDIPSLTSVTPVLIDEHNLLVPGVDRADGLVVVDYKSDNPGNVVLSTDGLAALNLTSQGEALTYALSADGKTITATDTQGNIVFGVTLTTAVNNGTSQNNAYTFVLVQPLDHVAGNGTNIQDIPVRFVATDSDGDSVSGQLQLSVKDDVPSAETASSTLDESSAHSVSGQAAFSLGADATGSIAANDSFSASGSIGNNGLSSNGVPVTVSLVNGVYVGTAGNVQVFTLTIASNGSYTFNQTAPLDHADGSNANDVISLNFGYTATDFDADTASSTITINVRDDAPVAAADSNSLADNVTSVSDTVITNDTLSFDTPNLVQSAAFNGTQQSLAAPAGNDAGGKFVLVNGAYGQLKIYENGQYTYTYDTARNTGNHTEQFTYTLVDKDGDTSTTTLTLNIVDNGPGNAPAIQNTVDETSDLGKSISDVITVANATAFAPVDNSFNATGSLPGNALTSNGEPVTVSLVNGQYVGSTPTHGVFTLTVNANGTYTFVQTAVLDHADGSNPNDVINLNFGYTASDADNDSVSGTITINFRDDAPVAVADTNSIANNNNVVSDNVLVNDDLSNDVPNLISQAGFNGVNKSLAAPDGTDAGGKFVLVNGAYGQLKLYETGQYTYTYNDAQHSGQHTDRFTYTLVDKDGDASSTTLTLNITDAIDIGVAPSVEITVDETSELNKSYSVTVTVAGASSFALGANGALGFSADGSLQAGALTSNGETVTVRLVNGQYVGSTPTHEVFTLSINNNGTYTFVQKAILDHADGSNPDDVINLKFAYTAQDSAGDTANGGITVHVRDDAPIAYDDANSVADGNTIATGDVLINDDLSNDVPNLITKAGFNGVVKYIATPDGTDAGGKFVLVDGNYGQLKIYESGKYTYTYDTANHGGQVSSVDFGQNGMGTANPASYNGLKFYAFDMDAPFDVNGHLVLANSGQDGAAIQYFAQGVGIVSNDDGYGEITYLPERGASEALAVELPLLTTRADVQLGQFYSAGDGPDVESEHGQWYAYNAQGNIVGSGEITADNTHAVGYGFRDFSITTIEAFQYLVFKGLPQVDGPGQTPGANGDSNFLINRISIPTGQGMIEDFNYTVADHDSDPSNAHLIIGI
ncbi:MAG: hypothetical protein JWM96_1310, partial [Alphaproteobacteria bacterium]|nr:hypothetical protein [Alphaproteobacteria bacterium]